MSVISLDEQRKKRANSSRQESQLRPNFAWEKLGLKPTDQDYERNHLAATFMVLEKAYQGKLKVNSRLARTAALWVGICASEGWISTRRSKDQWGAYWHPTEEGMDVKNSMAEIVSDMLPNDTEGED